jgi:hypothetical protein
MTQFVQVYDRKKLEAALGDTDEDHGYMGPEDERPPKPNREPENEIWARNMRRILDSPLGDTRPVLLGTPEMAARLVEATRSMPHFAEVTGIVARAIGLSALTGRPLTLPKILLLAPPGIGKTHYMGAVARAVGTKFIPIAMNATSDRWQLSGLSSFWRYAKLGKLAKGLLECPTASPLFAFDELARSAYRLPHDHAWPKLRSVPRR